MVAERAQSCTGLRRPLAPLSGARYPDAVALWEATTRSYFDEEVFPAAQTAVVRCEDPLRERRGNEPDSLQHVFCFWCVWQWFPFPFPLTFSYAPASYAESRSGSGSGSPGCPPSAFSIRPCT